MAKRAPNLTEDQKRSIQKGYESDMSTKDIAEFVGVSQTRVTTFWSRYQATKDLPPKVKISRRIINERMGGFIKTLVRDNPKISGRAISGSSERYYPKVQSSHQPLQFINFYL